MVRAPARPSANRPLCLAGAVFVCAIRRRKWEYRYPVFAGWSVPSCAKSGSLLPLCVRLFLSVSSLIIDK